MDHPAVRMGRETLLSVSSRVAVIRLAQAGLIASIILLATAPLAIPDGYSVVDHTLSEAGAQGVQGAWVLRAGVLLTSASVLLMISASEAAWSWGARRWFGVYAIALAFLAVLPEAPWDGNAHNALVAWLHTAAAVVGAVAFILAAFLISRRRSGSQATRRAYDWVVMGTIALIPQVMMVLPADGLLERLMVALGYLWLLAESHNIAASIRSHRTAPSRSR